MWSSAAFLRILKYNSAKCKTPDLRDGLLFLFQLYFITHPWFVLLSNTEKFNYSGNAQKSKRQFQSLLHFYVILSNKSTARTIFTIWLMVYSCYYLKRCQKFWVTYLTDFERISWRITYSELCILWDTYYSGIFVATP